jgi:hypothetical protein
MIIYKSPSGKLYLEITVGKLFALCFANGYLEKNRQESFLRCVLLTVI